jgi:thiamine-monophosphate kinase
MGLSEFDIISRFFARDPLRRTDVRLGIGDDCALLEVPSNRELAVSIDTLIEDVHFPASTSPSDLGHKSLAVGLSDLAAVGAQPAWATLSISLPTADEAWLEDFCKGFFGLAEQYNVQLVGGDTVRGPLVVTVQVHGLVPRGEALRRGGARPLDSVCVSGYLGDAATGLLVATEQLERVSPPVMLDRLNRPEPRVELGGLLRGLASSCIDISDGLIADLGHILEASQVSATLDLDRIPLSREMLDLIDAKVIDQHKALKLALTGGDDYELCFTLPNDKLKRAQAIAGAGNCRIIGRIGDNKVIKCTGGIKFTGADAEYFPEVPTGYDHFEGKGKDA